MRIYNLFPMVAGKINEWKKHLDKIKEMNFDHIFINPIFETGYSRSLYAPKDFYKFNSDLVDIYSDSSPEKQVREFIEEAHKRDIKIIMEVIMTHTAIDSELLIEHSNWFRYENDNLKNYSFNDGTSWVEWGDLIEIDNENSKDREELWKYWENILKYYIDLGVDGFKLHSAYRLPVDFLEKTISNIKEIKNDTIFIGDNLGASFVEMLELAQSGFDYLFTSFKWWDFSSTWFLEQHYKLKNIVKLISFPENYDTERLAERYFANENASKIWYIFSAFLNTAVMIPIGYEQGCRERLDNIRTLQEDLLEENIDIKVYIKGINYIKSSYKLFNEETDVFFISGNNENIFMMKKVSRDKTEEVLIIANMNYEEEEEAIIEDISFFMDKKNIRDISLENPLKNIEKRYEYILKAGEARILYGSEE